MLTQVGSVLATIVLARILAPQDFGLVVVAQTVVGLGSLFGLAGVSVAVMRARGPLEPGASTHFALASIVGAVGAVVLISGAPLFARVAGVPESTSFIRVLACTFPLSLMSLVPIAILQKNFRYNWNAWRLGVSAFTYFAAEITLAVIGFGAWSVILGQLLGAVANLVVALLGARWIPSHLPKPGEIRGDWRLVSGMTLTDSLNYVTQNVDYWAVGRALGPASLGVYYVAYVLPNIVRSRLATVFLGVMLPSAAQDPHSKATRDLWSRAATMLAGVALPVFVGLAAVANPILDIAFGAQWDAAVRPMQIICIGAFVDLMAQSAYPVVLAQRRVGAINMVRSAGAAFTLLSVIAAAAIEASLASFALAVAFASMSTLIFQDAYFRSNVGLGLHLIAAPLTTFASISAAMGLITALVVPPVSQLYGSWAGLAAGLATGTTCYLALGLTVGRRHFLPLVRNARATLRGL